MASRAQLTADVIRPALDAGRAVIADRYTLANVVYQGHAGGLDPEELWEVGRLATGGLEPDLTIVLDLPVELALARLQGPRDRFESRDREFQAKVRAGFLAEAQRRPERIRVVDGSQPSEVVQASIRNHVQTLLQDER
jgi:dTMP kinase